MKGNIHPLFDIHGRVALVTGGGSGLGREFCDVLAEFGADVVCLDLLKDRAEETCKIIKKHKTKTLAIEGDVSNYEQVRTLLKQSEKTFGKLDILVNNAGITSRRNQIDKTEIEDWHKVMNVNANGTFYCMKEGLRIMKKQKKGSIINITSIVGLYGIDPDISLTSPYVASKSAIIGLTKQAAAEYGSYGIRVNSIAPGWFFGTRLAEDAGVRRTEEELKMIVEKIAAKTPMRRTGELKELRGLLIFLASDASSFLTGQTIACDGGWTCL